MGWHPDSGQLARYSHVKDDEMLAGVLEHFDIETTESDIGKPSLEECPKCRATISDFVNPLACPGCGISLSHTTAEMEDAAEEIQEEATEAAIDSMDPEEIETLRAIRDAVDNPAALAEKLATIQQD